MVAVKRVAPAGTVTVYSCTSWLAIVGRVALELPSEPPAGVAVTWPKALVTVQLTGAGTPGVAEAIVWLMSPASSYVTMALLDVSGGR